MSGGPVVAGLRPRVDRLGSTHRRLSGGPYPAVEIDEPANQVAATRRLNLLRLDPRSRRLGPRPPRVYKVNQGIDVSWRPLPVAAANHLALCFTAVLRCSSCGRHRRPAAEASQGRCIAVRPCARFRSPMIAASHIRCGQPCAVTVLLK